MRLILLAAVALLVAGCCCPAAASSAASSAVSTPLTTAAERQFVVLRATALAAEAEGRRPYLLEMSIVAIRRVGTIEALEQAKRLDTIDVPVWFAGTQLPEAADFGEGARLLAMPSVVTLDGEDAVAEVGEQRSDGGFEGMTLRIAPTSQASGSLSIRFSYIGTQRGGTVFSVPSTMLEGPAGRVFIVQALERVEQR